MRTASTTVSGAERGRVVVLEHTVDIHRSPEEVFDYCSDITREPEWNPKLKHVSKLTPAVDGVGTRYEAQFAVGDPMVVECVHFERPVAWSTIGASRRLKTSFEGRVSPAGNGAHLVMRMVLEPRGLLRLATPFLGRYMRAQQDRNVAVIKAMLEGRSIPGEE